MQSRKLRLSSLTATAALATASSLLAQVPPAIPFSRTLDLLVVDQSYDGVWRLVDFNQDGDYNDADEAVPYFVDGSSGIDLVSPTCIAIATDGTVYVGESNTDFIAVMQDQNGDGDASDPGEARVFFDNANLSGLLLASVQGLTVDGLGRVFATDANNDRILILEDLNGDGDAQDVGEARSYHDVPGTTATGDSIPTVVLAGLDGNLYYAENGATGVVQKGVYRLVDLNNDGDCNDPGERGLFWAPPAIASPFYYGLAVDASFRFYITDHSTNEQVWTAFDADGSGSIDATEENLFYQTSASTWWDVVVRDDGTILLCEDQTPDRITALRDLNGDFDALDPGEATEAYDDTVSPNPDVRPRGAALLRAPSLAVAPAFVQIGQATSFIAVTETPQDLAAVLLSTGVVPPFPLPPFGRVEIDPTAFVVLGVGVSDASGTFTLPFPVPNTPGAIGTWGSQAWCGDAYRVFLSNAVLLTITP